MAKDYLVPVDFSNNIEIQYNGSKRIYFEETQKSIYIGENAGGFTQSYRNILIGPYVNPLLGSGDSDNVFIGYQAGYYTTGGDYNVVIGTQAGYGQSGLSDYSRSVFIGSQAGYKITTGDNNLAIGWFALHEASTTSFNICIGYQAGRYQTGSSGTFIGSSAGQGGATLTNTGNSNLAIGYNTGLYFSTGGYNLAIGQNAMIGSSIVTGVTGSYNSAIGMNALSSITSGQFNSAISYSSLNLVTEGIGNIGIGYQAGNSITTGDYNLVIGYDTDVPSPTGDYQFVLGRSTVHLLEGSMGAGSQYLASPYEFRTDEIIEYTGSAGVTIGSDIVIPEKSDHSITPVAGYGYLWVRSDTPSSLIFTDDAGTDYDLTAASGTPVSFGSDNQIPYTNSTTDDFDYSANLTFDGSTLDLNGTLQADIINEHTTDAGVTVEGVLLKDSDIVITSGEYLIWGALTDVALRGIAGTTDYLRTYLGNVLAVEFNSSGNIFNNGPITINSTTGYMVSGNVDDENARWTNHVYSNTATYATYFYSYRHGGSKATPAAAPTDADIALFRALANDGTTDLEVSRIEQRVVGAVSTGSISGDIGFYTRQTTGSITEKMVLSESGVLKINTINEYTTDAGVTVEGVKFENQEIDFPSSDVTIQYAGTDRIVYDEAYDSVKIGENAGRIATSNGLVAIGNGAAYSMTVSASNIAIGLNALYTQSDNTTGYNIAIGANALISANTFYNVVIGGLAGRYTTGGTNTIIGAMAGMGTSGQSSYSNNIMIGYRSSYLAQIQAYGIAIGTQTNYNLISGTSPIAIGHQAGYYWTSGSYNMLIGYQAGYGQSGTMATGEQNMYIGHNAGRNNTTGSYNMGIGYSAISNITEGNYNLVLGHSAGSTLTTGGYNILIGRSVNVDSASQTYLLRIGDGSTIAIQGALNTGAIKFPQYGIGTFTGTAAKWLAVDSSGNIIEEDAPSGGISWGSALYKYIVLGSASGDIESSSMLQLSSYTLLLDSGTTAPPALTLRYNSVSTSQIYIDAGSSSNSIQSWGPLYLYPRTEGNYVTIGVTPETTSFLTVKDNNTTPKTSITVFRDASNNNIFDFRQDGTLYFTGLGSNDTEDHVLAINDSTGLITKRAVSTIGGSASPLTTKGDIYTYSTADARLAVGTDGQILSADSNETTGLKWIDTPTGSGDVTKVGTPANDQVAVWTGNGTIEGSNNLLYEGARLVISDDGGTWDPWSGTGQVLTRIEALETTPGDSGGFSIGGNMTSAGGVGFITFHNYNGGAGTGDARDRVAQIRGGCLADPDAGEILWQISNTSGALTTVLTMEAAKFELGTNLSFTTSSSITMTAAADGPDLTIQAGTSTGSYQGGDLTVQGGTGPAVSYENGGGVLIIGGTGGNAGYCAGGDVGIMGGSSTSGTYRSGGNVYIEGGTGGSSAGGVYIGPGYNTGTTAYDGPIYIGSLGGVATTGPIRVESNYASTTYGAFSIDQDNATGHCLVLRVDANSASYDIITAIQGSTEVAHLDSIGDWYAADYGFQSDPRLKNVLYDKEIFGLELALSLKPRYYTWKDKRNDFEHLGFLTTEMEEVCPALVMKGDYDSISYGKISAINTAAIQELNAIIQDLKKQIQDLKNANN